MRLNISSQWDDVFLKECSRYGANEIYCSLRTDPIGSVRPAVCLPDSDLEQAKRHIDLVHSLGMEFNYIINAPCLGNIEFSAEGRKKIIDYLAIINDLGVDIVTVAIPYLIEIIKKEFPRLKIKASEIANVSTAQRARFYEELGVKLITIEIAQNRNFKILKSIRAAVKPETILEVVVNAGCLFQCPYHDYHNNIVSHTTQVDHFLHGYYMDYCMMRCIPRKLVYPEEIIKAPWIRPEDIGEYEKIGIDSFKISNRVGPMSIGLNCLKAYSSRSCENLADLLTPLSLEIEEPRSSRLPDFPEGEWNQMVKVWGIPSPAVYVDNKALNGFINYFKEDKCYGQCGIGCDYCVKIAEKVIKIDKNEVNKYVKMVDQLIQPLLAIKTKEKVTRKEKIEWKKEIREMFERLMQNTPEMFRDIATKTIGNTSESNAEGRGSKLVEEEDLVKALLADTPDVFKPDMIKSLENEGVEIEKYQKG